MYTLGHKYHTHTNNVETYLFIEELSGVFLYVSLVHVGGQTHQTDL